MTKTQGKHQKNSKNNSQKKDRQIKIYFNIAEKGQTSQNILQHYRKRADLSRFT